jgi:PKD repeat protein
MRKTLQLVSIIASMFFSLTVLAQDENQFVRTKVDHTGTAWFLELQSARPNYWKVKQEYEKYFAAHKTERSSQEKICRRWLETNAGNVDKDGFLLAAPVFEKQMAVAKTTKSSTSAPVAGRIAATTETFSGETVGSWRMIGPFHAAKTKCNGVSSYMSGGYTDRVYINPYKATNMFAGASYGGLWVSQDAGATWKLTDAEFPNGTNTYANCDYYYGEVEASRTNPQLVYAATEAGLLKSVNGGNNWAYCNELNRTVNTTTRPYFVAVAHDDQSTLLSSFGRKIYRSVDGGNSWSVVFDNSAGGANKKFANLHSAQPLGIHERTYNFWGLDFHPTDPNIVYIGVWNAANQPCIYKSTDKGVTFSLLVNIMQASGRTAAYGAQGLEMLTVMASPDKVFVRPSFGEDTIYHFSVNGSIINKIKPGTVLEAFTINWRNENIVYAGRYGSAPVGSVVKKSTDAGLTFTDMTSGYAACPKYVHPDLRGYSAVGDTVLVAHDGGLSRSLNGMNTIETVGYEISSIDLWGFSSSFKSDIALAGCDHGPTKVRRFDGDAGWIEKGGGDAAACTVNPANDSLFYYDHGYGAFIGKLNADNSITSTGISRNVSLHNLETHPHLYNTVYGIQGNQVLWGSITDMQVLKDFGMPVNRFHVALKDPKTMYVLLQNNIVQKSTNAGVTWTTITPASAQSGGQTTISDLELGAAAGDLWLIYSGTQTICKVLRSNDGGSSWSNITNGLPSSAAKQATYQRGTNGGLYISLEGNGVWYRNNTMTSWQQLGTGLPMLGYIRNLYTVPVKNKFRMGSSRGAWEHELIEQSGLDAQIAMDKNVVNRFGSVVKFRDYSAYNGAVTFEWSFPGGQPSVSTAEFPSVNYTQPGVYPVTLTIRDAAGNTSTQTIDSAITVSDEGQPGVYPIADAFVRDGGSAGSNFGTQDILTVKSDGVGFSRISYLKFDLSNYTDTFYNARLKLFLKTVTSASIKWHLYRCTNDSWTETGVNWNNKPDTSTFIGTINNNGSGLAEWDITKLLNSEWRGDKILTLAVVHGTFGGAFQVDFHSKEATTPLLRPQLMLNEYPLVHLDDPINGDVYETGGSTTVKASVNDEAKTASVTFYLNDQEKATDTQAPYEWNWSNMQAGVYELKAIATSTNGGKSTPDSIQVRVKDTTGFLSPVADAYVRDGSSATVNFGTQNTLVVKKDGTGFSRITYLKFNLQDYQQIDTARLKLFISTSGTGAALTQWQVWKCDNDNWTETGINWNNKPITTTLLTTIQGKRTGVAEWDISTAANAELAGDKVLTLAIVSTVVNGTADVTFHSKEATTASLWPQLAIEAPPQVSIVTPITGDSLIEQSTHLIKAKATDDKKVTAVHFYVNNEEKAVVTQKPFEWNWTNNAPGSYELKVKATDNSNKSAWSQPVTVTAKDTTPPVIIVPEDITVGNDAGQCGAIVNFVATATDNYSQSTISYDRNPGTQFSAGITTVTVTAKDEAGNSVSRSFTVTVNDTEKPVLSCAATQQFCYAENGTYTIPAATATDNCGINTVSFQVSGATSRTGNGYDASGVFNAGISIIEWTVTDIHGNAATCSTEVKVNPSLTATIADVYAVSPGGNANTIYLGYGPSSLTLNVLANAGTAPYSYAWSTGSTTDTTTVAPSTVGSHTYSVTITDAAGCTTVVTKQIVVADVRCGNNTDKVSVCHIKSSNHDNTICISVADVQSHLAHGCKLGECGQLRTTDVLTGNTGVLDVKIYPNPTRSDFRLLLGNAQGEPVSIRIMDISGRILKQIKTSDNSVVFGRELLSGVYFVEINKGNNKQTFKLIKL